MKIEHVRVTNDYVEINLSHIGIKYSIWTAICQSMFEGRQKTKGKRKSEHMTPGLTANAHDAHTHHMFEV